MGLLTTLFGGDPAKAITDTIAEFHASPEAKMQFQAVMDQHKTELQEKMAEWDAQLNDIAGQNIRQDSSSSDAFVRRVRPAFMYVMIFAIALAVAVFPLLNLCLHKGLEYPVIPAVYMDMFKVAFLGYAGLRTAEKLTGKD